MLKIVLFVKYAVLFFLLLSPVHAGVPSGSKSTLPPLLKTFLSGKNVKKYRLWGMLIRRKIKKEWLKGLRKQEVRLLRNAIFALYGVKFQSTELQTFFLKQSWYGPKHLSSKIKLPFRARKNMEIFALEEKRLEALLQSKAQLEKKVGVVSPKKAEIVPPKKAEIVSAKKMETVLEKPPIRRDLEKQNPLPAAVSEQKQSAKMAGFSQTQNKKVVPTSEGGSFRWLFLLAPLFLLFIGGWAFYALQAKKRLDDGSRTNDEAEVVSLPANAPPMLSLDSAPRVNIGIKPSDFAMSGLNTPSTTPSVNANPDKPSVHENPDKPSVKTETEAAKKGQIKARFKVYGSSPINAASTSKEISDTFGLNESASTTLSLFFQGDTLESIVEKRGLAESTIKTHLKSALEKGALSIEELLEVEEQDLRCIVDAWHDIGGKRKLSAAFERLDGAYDYDLLGFVFAALSHNPNLTKQ